MRRLSDNSALLSDIRHLGESNKLLVPMPKKVYKETDSLPAGFISLSEASELCSYSQEYLSLRARQGKIQAQKFGRNWFVKLSALEKYIDNNAADKVGNKKGEIK